MPGTEKKIWIEKYHRCLVLRENITVCEWTFLHHNPKWNISIAKYFIEQARNVRGWCNIYIICWTKILFLRNYAFSVTVHILLPVLYRLFSLMTHLPLELQPLETCKVDIIRLKPDPKGCTFGPPRPKKKMFEPKPGPNQKIQPNRPRKKMFQPKAGPALTKN